MSFVENKSLEATNYTDPVVFTTIIIIVVVVVETVESYFSVAIFLKDILR